MCPKEQVHKLSGWKYVFPNGVPTYVELYINQCRQTRTNIYVE